MRKKKVTTFILSIMMFIACLFGLVGCESELLECIHNWEEATCETPKTCSKCGEVEGDVLPHEWLEATCQAPKTCKNCEKTEGEKGDHSWVEATCQAPKTCSVCETTEGEVLPHTWVDATCQAPKTCSVCEATEGEALGHQWGTWVSVGGNQHKRTCSRDGAHTETEACSGGEATCTTPATCEVCHTAYGTADSTKHDYKNTLTKGETTHYYECKNGCGVRKDEVAHEFKNYTSNGDNTHTGTCVCGKTETTACSGGSATCTTLATCEKCNAAHGSVNANNHKFATTLTAGENTHYYACEYGCSAKKDEVGHAFTQEYTSNNNGASHTAKCVCGKTTVENCASATAATCVSQATCDKCSQKFGQVDLTNHNFGTTWEYKEADGHAHVCQRQGCDVTDNVVAHTPDRAEATETEPVLCTVCGYTIAPKKNHEHVKDENTWYNNENEHWRGCTGCNDYTADNAPHDWTNDCDTTCDTCGYVRVVTHDYKETKYDANQHWLACSTCGDVMSGSKQNHFGGDATCAEQAICEGCEQAYGELDADDHDFDESTWAVGNGEHYHACTRCDEGKKDATAHDFTKTYIGNAGAGTHEAYCICGASVSQDCSGGNATCSEKPTCEHCGEEYGDFDDTVHNYNTEVWGYQEEDGHAHLCLDCGEPDTPEEHDPDLTVEEGDVPCTVCGYIMARKEHKHVPITDFAKAATCTETGLTSGVHCATCDYVVAQEIVDALGHDYRETAEVSATCTTAGTTGYKKCTRCGDMDGTVKEVIPATNHENAAITRKAPTCTVAGEETVVCPDCGYKATTILAATNHAWEQEITCTQGASCTNEGCTAYSPALEHDYRTTYHALTCTTDEYTEKVCKRKGCDSHIKQMGTLATGHTVDDSAWTMVSKTPTPATARTTEEGCLFDLVYEGYCTECEQIVQKTEGSQVFHTEVVEITTVATCTTEGVKTFKCSVCDHVIKTETYMDAEGHKWNTTEADGVSHSVCEYNGEHTKTTVSVDSTNGVTAETIQNVNEVKVDNASMQMNETVLGQLSGNVTMKAEELTKEQLELNGELSDEDLEKIGDATVYNFELKADGNDVVFGDGGSITITVPYHLEPGEDPEAIGVWYINNEGTLEFRPATYANESATFTVEHFSYYTVTKLTPAERCARYGHREIETTIQATCLTDGYTRVVCQRCGKAENKNIVRAQGHNITTQYTAPTCTEDGKDVIKCSNEGCTYEHTNVLPKLGHKWNGVETKVATCTSTGEYTYTCAREGCEESYKTVSAMKAHEYEHVVTANTCTTDGYTTHTCTVCKYTYQNEFKAMTGHKYSSEVTKEATCTEVGVKTYTCEYCQDTKTEDIPVIAHVWDREEADCGNAKVCVYCQMVDEEATGNHTMVEGTCSVCGEGCVHDYKETVVEPTCEEDGYTLKSCTICNKTERVDYVKATGHVGDYKCEVCGEVLLQPEFFTNAMHSMMNDDFTMCLNGCEIVIAEKGMQSIRIETAELCVGLDESGLPFGYGYGKAHVTMYGETFVTQVTLRMDSEYVYMEMPNCPEMSSRGNSYNYAESTDVKVFDGYVMAPVNSMFMSATESTLPIEEVFGMMSMFVTWAREQIMPIVNSVVLFNQAGFAEVGGALLNNIFTIVKTDEGYDVSLDFDKLVVLNTKLGTKTIAELFNEKNETGYATFQLGVTSILDLTVGDLISGLDSAGISIKSVLAALDNLATTMMGGEEPITIEEMLIALELIPETMTDFEQVLADEELLGITVGSLILNYIPAEGMTINDLKKQIVGILDECGKLTAYDLVAQLSQMAGGGVDRDDDHIENEEGGYVGKEEIGKTETVIGTYALADGENTETDAENGQPNEEEPTEPTVVDTVNEMLAMFKEMMSIGYTADSEGYVRDISIALYGFPISEEGYVAFDVSFINGYISSVAYDEMAARVKALADKVRVDEDLYEKFVAEYPILAEGTTVFDANGILNSWSISGVEMRIENRFVGEHKELDENGNVSYFSLYEERVGIYDVTVDLSSMLASMTSDCGDWYQVIPEFMGAKTLTASYTRTYYYNYRYGENVILEESEPMPASGEEEFVSVNELINNFAYNGGYYMDFEYFFNIETGEGRPWVIEAEDKSYDDVHMHNYVEETKLAVDATGCTGMGEIHYLCTACGDTYTHYYTNGHGNVQYEFNVNGDSCYNGGNVRVYCLECGETIRMEEIDGHRSYNFNYADLSAYEGQICDRHAAYESTCPCGQYHYVNVNGWDKSESLYGEATEDGKQEYLGRKYSCNDCDFYYIEKSETLYDACIQTNVNMYTVYVGDTLVKEYRVEKVYVNHSGFYNKVTLLGTTCEDGALVENVCISCNQVTSSYTTKDHVSGRHYLYEGSKGGFYQNACACGERVSNGVIPYGDYTLSGHTIIDGESYQLFVFGGEEVVARRTTTETVGCIDYSTDILLLGCVAGDNGYTYERMVTGQRYESGSRHEYAYTGELMTTDKEGNPIVGEPNCYNGVIITEYCVNCDYSYSRETTGHETFRVENYHLGEASICGGEVFVMECACGQEHYVKIESVCDFGYSSEYVSEFTYDGIRYDYAYKYSCALNEPNRCGLVYYEAYKQEQVGCIYTQMRTYVFMSTEIVVDETTGEANVIETPVFEDVWTRQEERHNQTGTFIPEEEGSCYGTWQYVCSECEKFIYSYEGTNHSSEWITVGDSPCVGYDQCSKCFEKFSEVRESHEYIWGIVNIVEPTCSQSGLASYQESCNRCDYRRIEDKSWTVDPLGHEYYWNEEKGVYVCNRCALENTTDSDGSIVLEDCTTAEDYANGMLRVGFYDITQLRLDAYVSLILGDPNVEENIVTIPTVKAQIIENSTEEYTYYKCGYILFSESEVHAWAAANGYTEYDIRLSLVPAGGDGMSDYAITFTDLQNEEGGETPPANEEEGEIPPVVDKGDTVVGGDDNLTTDGNFTTDSNGNVVTDGVITENGVKLQANA